MNADRGALRFSFLVLVTALAVWPVSGLPRPDGHCVGFRELDKVCGNPPSRCVFENAPGTGENRECALAPRQGQTEVH
jgi:hypothetical protein